MKVDGIISVFCKPSSSISFTRGIQHLVLAILGQQQHDKPSLRVHLAGDGSRETVSRNQSMRSFAASINALSRIGGRPPCCTQISRYRSATEFLAIHATLRAVGVACAPERCESGMRLVMLWEKIKVRYMNIWVLDGIWVRIFCVRMVSAYHCFDAADNHLSEHHL